MSDYNREGRTIAVPMVSSANKVRYTCYVPRDDGNDESKEAANEPHVSIKKLLEPLASTCLYRVSPSASVVVLSFRFDSIRASYKFIACRQHKYARCDVFLSPAYWLVDL